jgi:hypothetical protein
MEKANSSRVFSQFGVCESVEPYAGLPRAQWCAERESQNYLVLRSPQKMLLQFHVYRFPKTLLSLQAKRDNELADRS